MTPLLMKMTAERSLKLTAAREISREHPGRVVRVFAAESGRTIVRFERDDQAGELLASYRCGELILPGATAPNLEGD